MTKSELKTGYIVTLRNEEEYIFIKYACLNNLHFDAKCKEGFIIAKGYNWEPIVHYNEDLTHGCCHNLDIIKVECPTHPNVFADLEYEKDRRTLVWKRKEKKKYTYAQIAEILGEEFEIVKE